MNENLLQKLGNRTVEITKYVEDLRNNKPHPGLTFMFLKMHLIAADLEVTDEGNLIKIGLFDGPLTEQQQSVIYVPYAKAAPQPA